MANQTIRRFKNVVKADTETDFLDDLIRRQYFSVMRLGEKPMAIPYWRIFR